jgi:DNA-binding MarR family transcriptional regulator
MQSAIEKTLRQTKPFPSAEGEVLVGLQIIANRLRDRWGRFLKSTADLTVNQYNVLRILRGAHPESRTCGEIAERMIERDPDITRLLDRLSKQGLADRTRDEKDRRVVRTGITTKGLAVLDRLDVAASSQSTTLLDQLGDERLEHLRATLNRVVELLDEQPDTEETE